MMNDLILQDSGALAISDSDRIRISAAFKTLSVNSSGSIRAHGIGVGSGSPIEVCPSLREKDTRHDNTNKCISTGGSDPGCSGYGQPQH